MLDSLLDHLARLRGIGEAYYDYRGELKYFSPATKKAILAAMGCAVTDAERLRWEIEELEGRHWRSLLPRVVVIRRGRPGVLLAVPADAMGARVQWRVQLEDGSQRTGTSPVAELTEVERRDVDGRWLTRRLLVLPDDLPLGYHELTVVLGMDAPSHCLLVVAPGLCFEPAALGGGARFWGLAVQLYTLRSQHNWGIGDFADLQLVVRECATAGAAFVGLNPLHALFPANPGHFSPYSPSTRHFLNVFYIAVPRVPEFADCAAARTHVASPPFQAELARLRATDRVDYPGVAAAKLPVLEKLYAHFREHHLARGTTRAQAFREFQRQRGEPLRRHALHDAIDTHLRATDGKYWGWPSWPEELRRPDAPGIAAFERANLERVEYYEWLQWVASEQLAEVQALARNLGMPVGLYGDYAVGVNPAGSETWSDQDVYRMGAGVGAPPDPLALKGQDWGIPPQDPQALIAAQYRPFRNLIAANMRHFGALRLDHVMALFRQWWVPGGLGSTDGGYVHYPLDDLMSVLALESDRNKCLVVGEDLGTVPDEMRHAMAAFAVYHYKVLLFEKESGGVFRRPEHYVRRAIATVTTHDLPTLRGYWEGRDLSLRDRLQLFPDEDIRRYVYDERVRDRAQLLAALESCKLRPAQPAGPDGDYTEELGRAVQLYLARSASALVVLQIEDIVGMTDPVNVPGTSNEHANWQRKVSADLADVFSRPFTRQLFSDVNRARTT
jgi:4-alpha-glucanotransferase